MHELQEISSSAARASVAGLNEVERDSIAKKYVANAIANSALFQAVDMTVTTGTSGNPAVYYEVTLAYSLDGHAYTYARKLFVAATCEYFAHGHHSIRELLT